MGITAICCLPRAAASAEPESFSPRALLIGTSISTPCGWVRSTSSQLPAVQPTWNGWSCKRCATNTLEPGRSHLCNRRQARCRKTPYTNQRDAQFLNALTLKGLATLRALRSLHEYESTAGPAPMRVLLRAAKESESLRQDPADNISRRFLAAFP